MCVIYLCLCLSHGFKTKSETMMNVTFVVVNVMFFSSRDYILTAGQFLIT